MCNFELQHPQNLEIEIVENHTNEQLEYLTKKADEYEKLIANVNADYKRVLSQIEEIKENNYDEVCKRDDKATLILTKKTNDGTYRISSTRLDHGINFLVLKKTKYGYEKVLEVDVTDDEFTESVAYLKPEPAGGVM